MAPKNKRKALTAAQLDSLPIPMGEARKLLGNDALKMSDEDVAFEVLSLNELAIFLTNNIDLHKMHL